MSLRKTFPTMLFGTLLVTFTLHVHAGEPQDNSVSVRGLVVSSGHELLINDGVRDFILLGVDTSDYEGKICEAFGVIGHLNGTPTLKVKTITIIADEYPDEDLVGENRGFGSLGSKQHGSVRRTTALASPGTTITDLCDLSLPSWEGGGMRTLGDASNESRTACRFQSMDISEEA